MAIRVSEGQLQAAIDLLNITAGLPLNDLSKNFQLDHTYNRVGLTQFDGSKRIIDGTAKGDLFDKIHILIAGIEFGKQMGKNKREA